MSHLEINRLKGKGIGIVDGDHIILAVDKTVTIDSKKGRTILATAWSGYKHDL